MLAPCRYDANLHLYTYTEEWNEIGDNGIGLCQHPTMISRPHMNKLCQCIHVIFLPGRIPYTTVAFLCSLGLGRRICCRLVLSGTFFLGNKDTVTTKSARTQPTDDVERVWKESRPLMIKVYGQSAKTLQLVRRPWRPLENIDMERHMIRLGVLNV